MSSLPIIVADDECYWLPTIDRDLYRLTHRGIAVAVGTNILRLAALLSPDMTVYDAELAGWKIERKAVS